MHIPGVCTALAETLCAHGLVLCALLMQPTSATTSHYVVFTVALLVIHVCAPPGLDYTRSPFGCTAPGVPASCSVLYAADLAPDDNSLDADGHGTNVASIIAGVQARQGQPGVLHH